jgi:uncharacterized DUF497 family protein
MLSIRKLLNASLYNTDKHWSAVITYHSDKIRIISVRRSRTEEVNIYES